MANAERLKQVLARIEQHPEQWDQSRWHCGSSHCFCGMAQIMAGYPADDDKVRAQAREWLGLSLIEFDSLASGPNTLKYLRRRVGELMAGYDGEGYDCNGYDCEGYDRRNRDRNGYLSDSCPRRYRYDRDGYDNDGLDINNKPRPTVAAG